MLFNFYPHAEDANEVLKNFSVVPEAGLTNKEAEERIKRYGQNVLKEEKGFVFLKTFLNQFRNPLTILLLAAGIITIFLEEYHNAAVIFLAVIINSLIGFFEEKKAADVFAVLKKSLKKYATVVREGEKQVIESTGLALGDIIMLEEGDMVPADCRIIEGKGLEADESMLTGEWLSVQKNISKVDLKTRVSAQSNMLFMGTLVANGFVKAVIVRTGENTEFGKLAKFSQEKNNELTPFQKQIKSLSRFIGIFVVLFSLILFILGVFQGKDINDMFLSAVAIVVAAVPEGLPIAVTIILVLGSKSIFNKGGLIKKTLMAETLGGVDVILIDKTGTLTKSQMKISRIITANDVLSRDSNEIEKKEQARINLLMKAQFISSAFIENQKSELKERIIRGKPMEKAILEAGIESGLEIKKIFEEHPRVDFLPFNSERRFFASLHKFNGDNEIYIGGAPEAVLELCSTYQTDLKECRPLKDKELFKESYESFMKEGGRMIAVCFKTVVQKEIPRNDDHFFEDFCFLGFIAFQDSLREDAKESLEAAKNAGIQTVIVTGDSLNTAKAVAENIGLVSVDTAGLMSDNPKKQYASFDEIDDSDKDNILSIIEDVKIWARVLPHQKMALVESWQAKNKIVAMTGDGVNDVPALKRADIGIALNSGTDAAREAADLILINNSFNVIVEAVKQGRIIVDNIRKVLTYLLSSGFTEMILIGGSVILNFPLPVLPNQILWANIMQEGFMNFAYAFEKEEDDVLKRKKVSGDHRLLFTKEMKIMIFVIGIITDIFLLALFIILLKLNYDLTKIRTIMFAGLSSNAIFFALSLKNLSLPIWKINIFSNKYLLFFLVLNVLLLAAALFLQPLQNLLDLTPLSFYEIMIILGIGVLNFIAIETAKLFIASRKNKSAEV